MADVEMVAKVLRHITLNPETFDMESWIGDDTECGTTACVAGWAAILSGRAVRDPRVESGWVVDGSGRLANPAWSTAGRAALGISEDLAGWLFHTTGGIAVRALWELKDGKSEDDVRRMITREEAAEYHR